MPRLWEEVEGRHRDEVVILVDDLLYIPRQGSGVVVGRVCTSACLPKGDCAHHIWCAERRCAPYERDYSLSILDSKVILSTCPVWGKRSKGVTESRW
jgi:hypothetical protein